MTTFFSYLISVILMVVFFGLCIIIHEFGHFIVAKLCKLHVIAFSVGFKKIWGKKINGVEYRIGCIPCGGYVDLPQIDASTDEITDENGNPLPHASPWARLATAFAGPLFNILFAMFLGIFVYFWGIPKDSVKYTEFTVQSVEEESPEYKAGLRKGDRIVKLNGHEFNRSWQEFVQTFILNEDNVEKISLDVIRGNEKLQITYIPAVNHSISPEEDIIYPFFTPEIPVLIQPDSNGSAERAGLKSGDIVKEINGKTIVDREDLISIVEFSNGETLHFSVIRAGKQVDIDVLPDFVQNQEARFLIGINYGENLNVLNVIPNLPAEKVLKSGDTLLSVNGVICKETNDFGEQIKKSNGTPCKIEFMRDGQKMNAEITPLKVQPYTIGVHFYMIAHPTPFQQFQEVLSMTKKTFRSLGNSLGKRMGINRGYKSIGVKNMSGPVGIGRFMITTFHASFMSGLALVVMICYSLGIFNLLPIPVLDGGHILFAIVEIIARKPIPAKIMRPIFAGFTVVLIGFMLLVTCFDVWKVIPKNLFISSNEPAEELVSPSSDTESAMIDKNKSTNMEHPEVLDMTTQEMKK